MLSLSQLVADWDSHEASMQSVRATIRFAEDSILSIRAEQEECGRDIIEEMDRAGRSAVEVGGRMVTTWTGAMGGRHVTIVESEKEAEK